MVSRASWRWATQQRSSVEFRWWNVLCLLNQHTRVRVEPYQSAPPGIGPTENPVQSPVPARSRTEELLQASDEVRLELAPLLREHRKRFELSPLRATERPMIGCQCQAPCAPGRFPCLHQIGDDLILELRDKPQRVGCTQLATRGNPFCLVLWAGGLSLTAFTVLLCPWNKWHLDPMIN